MTSPEKSSSEPQPEEEEDLPEPLRKQIVRHLKTMLYGELTLIVVKGQVKFVQYGNSEQAES